jgi:L-alanine-DL-glutamate epimerase-like enolase superfamily enzyme
MKITGVKATRPAGADQKSCIVELLTDAGAKGIAIAAAGARAQIKRLVKERLIGADPRGVTGIWQLMSDPRSAPRGKAYRNAIAALDLALWDLKAKANGEPLWKTLGGARPRANAYASHRNPAASDAELTTWFQRMAREHGLRGGKLRAGADANGDARRLGLMRAALAEATPDPVLMIDAGHSWPVKQAIDRVRAVEQQFDLTWIEGVSRDGDSRGLRQLSDSIYGAVCAGTGLVTIGEFLPHFERRSADVIALDIGAVGITAALQIADAAYGLELPVTLAAAPGNIHVHLAGAMPYFMSAEIVDPLPATRLFTSDVRIADGWAVAGDRPGNGLVLS